MSETKLDTAFEPILAMLAAAPPVSSLAPEEARALWADADMGEKEAVWRVRDMDVPGASGAIAARFYCPARPTAFILYLHGGGWVLGDLAQHDPAIRAFANRTGAAILSINYRLAPEHPFPAGLEDGYAALKWCHAHRDELVGAGARFWWRATAPGAIWPRSWPWRRATGADPRSTGNCSSIPRSMAVAIRLPGGRTPTARCSPAGTWHGTGTIMPGRRIGAIPGFRPVRHAIMRVCPPLSWPLPGSIPCAMKA